MAGPSIHEGLKSIIHNLNGHNFKRGKNDSNEDGNINTAADMDISACPEEDSLDAATANAWIGRDLAAKLRKAHIRPPIYTGEDGMDDDDDLDLSNRVDPLKVLESDLNLPVIDFTIEECQETWKPWKKVLILKLLGKIISYRMLEQRTRDL